MPLYLNNTNQWMVRGFSDPLVPMFTPGASPYLNAASTATWALRTAANGGGVLTASGTLTYITASNGDYYLRIPSDTVLVLDQLYYLSVLLIQSSLGVDVQLYREQRLVAEICPGKTPTGN